ncbi:MAG: heme o synthase [Candidatus Zixiibacteriota bacterium]
MALQLQQPAIGSDESDNYRVARPVTDYVQLTKPRVMLLVVFTGATSLFIEGSLLTDPVRFALVLLGLYLTGGAANAFNQYFERDIDGRMARTKHRRPLPSGRLRPLDALMFAFLIGIAGVLVFGFVFNWLSALISLGTILFYSLFYTLLLKPNTPYNIVIGGAAGSMAPVIAWAAAAGSLSMTPWMLFLIVFLWTPPHFWALAVSFKDDYETVDLPMLTVVKGVDRTMLQIVWYSFALEAASILPALTELGLLYIAAAIVLGALFIRKAIAAKAVQSRDVVWGLFGYSIIYLFGLFSAMMVDLFLSPRLSSLAATILSFN